MPERKKLDKLREQMRARLRVDGDDAYARAWLDGSEQTEKLLTEKAPVGRRSRVPVEVRERMRAYRREGLTLAAIADLLNAEGVPTPQGGSRWYPSSVRSTLAARD